MVLAETLSASFRLGVWPRPLVGTAIPDVGKLIAIVAILPVPAVARPWPQVTTPSKVERSAFAPRIGAVPVEPTPTRKRKSDVRTPTDRLTATAYTAHAPSSWIDSPLLRPAIRSEATSTATATSTLRPGRVPIRATFRLPVAPAPRAILVLEVGLIRVLVPVPTSPPPSPEDWFRSVI